MRKAEIQSSGFCCSFCRKSRDSVSKLIANPGDSPKVYICDECVAVCASILEDNHDRLPAVSGRLHPGVHPLLDHRMTSSLLSAIEHWIRHESQGVDAVHELGEVRRIAVEMMMEQYPGKSHL